MKIELVPIDSVHIDPAFPAPLARRVSLAEAISDLQDAPGIAMVDDGYIAPSDIAPSDIAPSIRAGRAAVLKIRQVIGNKAFRPVVGSGNRSHPTITASGASGASGWVGLEGDISGTAIAAGVASIAGVLHQSGLRKFTIAELKRVCAFPDDFALVGSYVQKWARLGNAVPPLMARAVAVALRDRVLLPAQAAGK